MNKQAIFAKIADKKWALFERFGAKAVDMCIS